MTPSGIGSPEHIFDFKLINPCSGERSDTSLSANHRSSKLVNPASGDRSDITLDRSISSQVRGKLNLSLDLLRTEVLLNPESLCPL